MHWSSTTILCLYCLCCIFTPVYMLPCILDMFMYGLFLTLTSVVSCSDGLYICDQSTNGFIHIYLCSINLPIHICVHVLLCVFTSPMWSLFIHMHSAPSICSTHLYLLVPHQFDHYPYIWGHAIWYLPLYVSLCSPSINTYG